MQGKMRTLVYLLLLTSSNLVTGYLSYWYSGEKEGFTLMVINHCTEVSNIKHLYRDKHINQDLALHLLEEDRKRFENFKSVWTSNWMRSIVTGRNESRRIIGVYEKVRQRTHEDIGH